eukprot:SAG31_NODE_43960_length_265_cov_0.560241_1_plen_32_part_10
MKNNFIRKAEGPYQRGTQAAAVGGYGQPQQQQ